MTANKNETFGLIKTLVDAHTMGVHAAAALLRDCGYHVIISPKPIEYAMERIAAESAQKTILDWIDENHIARIGFSYRLDPDTAVDLMGRLIYLLTSNGYYGGSNPKIKSIFFAGLTPAFITAILGMVFPGSAQTKIFGTTIIAVFAAAGGNPLLAAVMLPVITGAMEGMTPPLALCMYTAMGMYLGKQKALVAANSEKNESGRNN